MPTQNTVVSTTSATAITPFSWFLIFAIPAFWAVNYLVGRSAPHLIGPHTLACARWFLSALILGFFARKELYEKRHLIHKERWHFVVFGSLGMWICGAWLYLGARTSPTNNIALIYALSPVFIVLGAAFFLHEHLRKRQWLGVSLALLGLVHVVIQGRWAAFASTQFVVGDLWVLGCAVAWAIYSLLLKKWQSAFSPLARLVLIAFAGAAVMLPLVAWELMSGLPLFQTTWTGMTFILIVAAAVFPGACAYLGYSTLQKNIGAARTAMVLYLGPLYAATLAWFALGEPLHLYHAVGALIILPGIYLASQSKAES